MGRTITTKIMMKSYLLLGLFLIVSVQGILFERRDSIRIFAGDFEPLKDSLFNMIMDRANLTGQGYYEMITNTTEVIPSSASSTFAWEFYKIIPCKNVATVLLQL